MPSYSVFKNRFISNVAGYAPVSTSEPFQLDQNNKAIVALTIQVLSGTSPTLTVALDGSIDGNTWRELGTSGAIATWSYYENAVSAVSYPMLRLRATVGGTGASVLFDASVGLSQQ